jgi:hypothetical protein
MRTNHGIIEENPPKNDDPPLVPALPLIPLPPTSKNASEVDLLPKKLPAKKKRRRQRSVKWSDDEDEELDADEDNIDVDGPAEVEKIGDSRSSVAEGNNEDAKGKVKGEREEEDGAGIRRSSRKPKRKSLSDFGYE